MRERRETRHLFEDAEKIGRLHDHRGGFGIDRAFQAIRIHLARARKSDLVDAQAEIARVGLQHLAIFRMQRPRHYDAMPPGQPLGHEHGLGGRRRAVPHGRVGDFHPGELAHQRLKLEDRLQRALADFRLIWRVGSEEFAALDQRIRDHRAQMVVDARAEKTRIPAGIFRRARAKIFDDFLLGHRSGELQRLFQPELFRDRREQVFDGPRADGIEHFPALDRALGKIAHQAEASFSEMNAW